jgi:hypothetical protein
VKFAKTNSEINVKVKASQMRREGRNLTYWVSVGLERALYLQLAAFLSAESPHTDDCVCAWFSQTAVQRLVVGSYF